MFCHVYEFFKPDVFNVFHLLERINRHREIQGIWRLFSELVIYNCRWALCPLSFHQPEADSFLLCSLMLTEKWGKRKEKALFLLRFFPLAYGIFMRPPRRLSGVSAVWYSIIRRWLRVCQRLRWGFLAQVQQWNSSIVPIKRLCVCLSDACFTSH